MEPNFGVKSRRTSAPKNEPGLDDGDLEIPPLCLLCGLTIPEDESDSEVVTNDEYLELLMFQCFLRLFGVKPEKIEADEEGHLPFCKECKPGLMQLIELDAKLKELESALAKDKRRIREQLEGSESRFQSCSIYSRDVRYYRIRRHILGERKVIHPKSPLKRVKLDPETEPGLRRSSRTTTGSKKTKEVLNSGCDSESEFTGLDLPDHPTSVTGETANIKIELPSTNDPSGGGAEFSEENYAASPNHEPGEAEDDNWSPDSNFLQSESEEESEASESDQSYVPDDAKSAKVAKSLKPESSVVRKVKNASPRVSPKTKLGPQRSGRSDAEKTAIRGSYSKEKITFNKMTGNYRYLKVEFQQISEDNFKCLQCQTVVPSHSTLKNHVVRDHTDLFVCKICGQHKASRSDLNKHVREVHEGKLRKIPVRSKECPICGKPFSNNISLAYHKATHYNEEDRREAEARGEKVMLQQEAVPKVQCGICGAIFCNVSWLKRHEKTKHPASEQDKAEFQRVCPDCGKSFSEHYFKYHVLRVHSNASEETIKPYICSFCDKRFYSHARLVQHKRIHTGEKPFVCTFCGKDFMTKKPLEHHIIRNHETTRPFQCHLCSAGFATKYHLERHVSGVHEHQKQTTKKQLTLDNL